MVTGQGYYKGLPLQSCYYKPAQCLPTTAGLLRRLRPARRRVAPLSPVQEERLEQLRQRAAATFSDDVAEHQVSCRVTLTRSLRCIAPGSITVSEAALRELNGRLRRCPGSHHCTARAEACFPRRHAAPGRDATPLLQAALRQLWEAAFPGSPYPKLPSAKHEQWKELGFQSDVPARDLSRCGWPWAGRLPCRVLWAPWHGWHALTL